MTGKPNRRKVSRMTPRKANPQKAGRKSTYLPLYATQAKNLCLLNQGITDEEMARFFEITVSCLNNWKLRYPEFVAAIREGKEVANTQVVAALYKRAVGGFYLGQKEVKLKREEFNAEGKLVKKYEEVKVVDLLTESPPDSTACMYFLNNRSKVNWQARSTLSGPEGGPIPLGMVALDDLLKTMVEHQ